MEFCPNCHSILLPKKEIDKDNNSDKTTLILACKCGFKKEINEKNKILFNEKIEHKEIEIIDEENEHIGDDVLPIKCWNCGNIGVYFWLVQMRRADEPPTRFYKCKKCKKVWRSGK
ncbi:MAG: transcription factor S [Candidatus Woesearchaeota archaeon]